MVSRMSIMIELSCDVVQEVRVGIVANVKRMAMNIIFITHPIESSSSQE